MTDELRETVRMLDEAIDKPPVELKAEVDEIERSVVRLRDGLIDRLRAAPDARVRAALDQVNAALSLVVGLEYPVGGVQRDMLKQARQALAAVPSDALSS